MKHRSAQRDKNDYHEDDRADEAAAAAAREGSASGGAANALELLGELEAERDDLRAKYQRALADYQNLQRRLQDEIDAARQRGVESAVASVITALDHIDHALTFDPDKVSGAQIVEGVKMIKNELLGAMRKHGAAPIHPEPNDEFDPQMHEAVMREAAPDVLPGRVVRVCQSGYAVGKRVIRPAKVVVAPPDEEA